MLTIAGGIVLGFLLLAFMPIILSLFVYVGCIVWRGITWVIDEFLIYAITIVTLVFLIVIGSGNF